MKREAQPPLFIEGQRALDHYAHALQQLEDLSAVTIRNYLSDLRQFMAWCECSWREEQDEQPFTPQAGCTTLAHPLPDPSANDPLAQALHGQSHTYEPESVLRLGSEDADHSI